MDTNQPTLIDYLKYIILSDDVVDDCKITVEHDDTLELCINMDGKAKYLHIKLNPDPTAHQIQIDSIEACIYIPSEQFSIHISQENPYNHKPINYLQVTTHHERYRDLSQRFKLHQRKNTLLLEDRPYKSL